MRKHPQTCTTPLLHILRELGTAERRLEFAQLAGTTTSYLYQLASCTRGGSCRALLAKGIADASKQMNARFGTPVITMEEIATMCQMTQAQ